MRFSIRHLTPRTSSLVFCASLLVLTVSVRAQQVAPVGGANGPFAPPWGVTFQKIKDAMESNCGGIAVEQTRRVRRVDDKTKAVSYPGTLEQRPSGTSDQSTSI